MARIKDPMQEKAIELLKDGAYTNREIADKLNIDERKVSTWKSRYINKKNDVQQKKKSCTTNVVKVEKPKMTKKEIEVVYDSGLTEKRRDFCLYYIQSFNGTQSAIKAGYSKQSAFVEASRLLKDDKVKEYLNKLKSELSNDDYLDAKRLLDKHKQIAFADVKDYTEFRKVPTVVGINKENGEPIVEDVFDVRVKDDSQVDGTLIKKISMGKYGPILELEDRSKSLEFLSKYHSLDPSFEIARKNSELAIEKVATSTKEKIEQWLMNLDENKISKLLELIDNES